MLGQVPILLDLGRWDDAIRIEAEYDAMAGAEFADSDVPAEMVYGVWVHLWRGEVAAAKRLRARLSFLFDNSSLDYGHLTRAVEASLLRADGHNAAALELIGSALGETGRALDDLYIARWVLQEGADAAFALDDLTAVSGFLDGVTIRFRRGLGPALDAQVSLINARLAAAQERDADVSAHARDAVDLFDEMQMPFWTAVARLEHGEWLTIQGRAEEAEEMLAQAASTFADLGAAPWLERAGAASGKRPAQREAATAMPA
jgi:hypothetical protein